MCRYFDFKGAPTATAIWR